MPRTTIKTFEVDHLGILDIDGKVDTSINHGLSEDQIKEMYKLMYFTRTFDEKLFKLQRSGKIGTYAQLKGQEACQIGSAMALDENDWVVPSFREMGVLLARGADRVKVVQSWNGDVRFYEKSRNLPPSIPIASQTLHATGIAWGEKLKKTQSAVIVYFGDGATSEGDFHEALNFASTMKLPVIFFCQNNQWAISTPHESQMANQTIAQRAIGYDMKGIQVDGNDVLAVYQATKEALENARHGDGPTLIEAMTFRMGDHTTSDDSGKYRSEELVKSWEEKDPLLRVKKHFEILGTWNEEEMKKLEEDTIKEIDEAVEKGLAIEKPPVENLFEHIFVNPPKDFEEQLKEAKEAAGESQ